MYNSRHWNAKPNQKNKTNTKSYNSRKTSGKKTKKKTPRFDATY